VIAAIQWLSAATYLLEIAGSLEARFFGYPLSPMGRTTYYALLASVAIFVALGLYRMKDSARRWAICFLVLTFLDSVAWSIATPTPHGGFSWMRAATISGCLVMDALAIWYLITRRGRFYNDRKVLPLATV